jgi:photosystem II stability/assembly factor-like uncharacterized protein
MLGSSSMSSIKRYVLITGALLLLATCALQAEQWVALGPDGGDVRSLAYDPKNPDRVFLGTSSAQLFVSEDSGRSWKRFAHLGDREDYVLDHILIDPRNPQIMFVGAWSVDSQTAGDVFRSKNGGQSWQALSPMHGKSVRAMAVSKSNPDVLVAGALDGVYRSDDGGENWTLISRSNQSEIKNIESIAIDPVNPRTIYAGTWHLAWKTDDGGANWHHINKGMIDDSDVFSVIVNPENPSIVFASACSGIYKSEAAGELFKKIQGIPFSARRTRVLHEDPSNPNIVYAGTTEGLWKTADLGKTWKRVTNPEVVVNDVYVDPRDSKRVLLATDRSGVLASVDGAETWVTSNKGYAHRTVQALLVDRHDPDTIYAGLMNDREFGGVFVSNDGGVRWQQRSGGLDGRDVLALRQTASGALVAGTHKGIFILERASHEWRPANTVVKETASTRTVLRKGKKVPVTTKTAAKSELTARVKDLEVSGDRWWAATASGLYSSADQGKSWNGGAVMGNSNFVAVRARGNLVVAASMNAVYASSDAGATWKSSTPSRYLTKIYGLAFAPQGQVFVASREGGYVSTDSGATWDHLINGLPTTEVASIQYDEAHHRFVATSRMSSVVFESVDGGRVWQRSMDMGYPVTALGFSRGRVLGASLYNGVVGRNDGPGSKSASAAEPTNASGNNR